MATSVTPESGREAAAPPAPAAREASSPTPKIAPSAMPGGIAGPRANEGVDEFKDRVRSEARARAMELATKGELPGAGAPALSDADAAAALLDINRRAADPVGALLEDAAGEIPAAPVAPVEGAPAAEPVVEGAPPAEAPPAEAPVEAPTGVTVEIAVPGQEQPFVLEVGDQATADVIGELQRRAERADDAKAIRAEAARIRDETDDFRYVVDLDPAGVLQESVTDQRDQEHLFRYLATRPGILERNKEWLADAVEDTPERAKERGELMELERLKRRDMVRDSVNERRANRQSVRQVAETIQSSIESLAPQGMSPEALDLLYEDVTNDVDNARRRAGPKFDRRNIPGIIQHRFKLLGIAPRGSAPAPKASDTPPTPSRFSAPPVVTPKAPPAVVPSAKTAAQLRDAARARQDAATASPGQGSEVSRVPAAPAYDPSQPGDAISQRVAWAKKVLVPAMARRPVG